MHPDTIFLPSPISDTVLLLGRIEDFQGPLFDGEEPAISKAVDKRRKEFIAGRTLARIAMKKLGFPATAVPGARDRQAEWPAGLTGSISHSAGHCAVALCRKDVYAVGIDIEESGRIEEMLHERLFTEDERDVLMACDPEAQETHSTILFGAKEAFYKLQYPFTGIFMGFHDVSISIEDQRIQAKPSRTLPGFPAPSPVEGYWSSPVEGLVLSVFWIRH